MRIKFLIKVQSASDVITNSSSEVFLCKNTTSMTADALRNFVFEYHSQHEFNYDNNDFDRNMSEEERQKYDFNSGMGGFLKIITYDETKNWKKHYFENLKDPENYILVDTDWSHYATIKWIRENLKAELIY